MPDQNNAGISLSLSGISLTVFLILSLIDRIYINTVNGKDDFYALPSKKTKKVCRISCALEFFESERSVCSDPMQSKW